MLYLKTLLILYSIFVAGEIVLLVTALPFAIKEEGITLGGMIVAMILIGLGQGGATAVIFPFLGKHQYDQWIESLGT